MPKPDRIKPDRIKPDRSRFKDENIIRGMAKNMRNLEDIMASYIAGEKLPADEERLLDRMIFEKEGKHIGKFKDKKPKPNDEVVLSPRDGMGSSTKEEARAAAKKARKASENVS